MKTLALLFVLLFVSSAWSQSQVPPPTPSKTSQKPEAKSAHHEEPTAKDQRGTEASPVFIKVLPTSVVEPQPTNETESKNDYASPEWALVYATIVLVAFTGGLMCYTARLWRETKNLARDAKKTAIKQAADTEKSLAIARQSADAATDTVATMERNARKELRAYMGVGHIVIYDDFSGSSSGYVEITIENFGNTMAKATEIWIVARELISDPDFAAKEERKSKTVVMPHEALGFKEPIDRNTDSAMSTVKPGTISIWGIIEYEDVFNSRHWTTFRFKNAKREEFLSPNRVTYGWSTKTCDDGNDAGTYPQA